jgi:predicted nucleotidyltransferase
MMKIVGLIVEYNPLHYGHIHHIEETQKILEPDVLIAVMSGNVVQRGEIAITDKFTRTKMALEAGIDLVVE